MVIAGLMQFSGIYSFPWRSDMSFEQLVNISTLLFNLGAIMICLFEYVMRPRKSWIYAIIFFLSSLLSNYYWCIYMLVMNDYPNVSSVMAYFGWNCAYLVLPVLVYHTRYHEEKGFFSPLCLLPVPLNVVQFIIYIQYGGYFNNIWQTSLTTIAACLCINSIIFYLKNKKDQARPPYVPVVVLMYIITEYTMWTASCFYWPSEALNPYNYASVLDGICLIMLPCAIISLYRKLGIYTRFHISGRMNKVYKPLYVTFVSVCCIGGYLIALWMRNTLTLGINQVGDADPYSVIAVMLFVVSLIIVSFSLTIILVVSLEHKSVESEEFKTAKVIAERSNASKSDFLANMSHEIRTPINAVLGMNEMIFREALQSRDELPEDRDDIRKTFSDICNYSGNITSAGNSLLSIINDILDFSKIEAGKMEIVTAEYQLSSVLNDVSNMISFKAKSKELEFHVDVDDTVPDGLYGDELRVRQVITNILNNAVKYTHDGSITLSVRSSEHPSSDEAEGRVIDLIVGVKDTGIGIRPEDQAKLFGKFERVDLNQNSTIEGTGLGLAITQSLLHMMGGKINVESEYGQGSTFTITIPQLVASDEPIGDFREKFEQMILAQKAKKEAFHAPNAHILIVDDTIMNLVVAKGLLKNTGIQIDTAESGRESIEMCKNNSYDLILMDQRMPEMDGITAMKEIRNIDNSMNSDTPFICLTADAVSGAKEKYLSEGFDDYLSKPIDSRALEKILIKYLPDDKINTKFETVEKPEERTIDPGSYSAMDNTEDAESDIASDTAPDNLYFDIETGMKFSGGDEDLYIEIVKEYVNDAEHKRTVLTDTRAAGDWQNYAIVAHSLKSTSKMIGSMQLADIALRMEKAADVRDTAAIDKEHDTMMDLYKLVVDALRNYYNLNDEAASDDTILEFSPE